MFKNLSIRMRLTLYSALLLSFCCIGLTTILNISAYDAVDSLQAPLIMPSLPEGTYEAQPPLPIEAELAVPTTEALNAKRGFSMESILYMLLTVLGGSALTYYIAGKTLKPLVLLNGQVKNIAVHNLSESLPVPPTKDEIAELSVSFNEMTDKLHEAFLMQQRFSASAAHELRTPLAVLQTKIDVFKKQSVHTKEEYDDLITVMSDQTLRLRKLVKALLDMTNMNDIEDITSMRLKDMMVSIIDELSLLANEKNVCITHTIDDSVIIGNIDLFYRAFYNLIENSIKYNREDGSVHISIKATNEKQVEIMIQDTGIGIPDDQKKHIFEPFYRVDKSRSRGMGGAGLGLAFVESLIHKHGGEIHVFDHETSGTCFRIVLNNVKSKGEY